MATDKWKATIVLSSDHAGINKELGSLERELLRGLARIEDPRKIRDWLTHLCAQSDGWCYRHAVDLSGWQERFSRKSK